MEEERGGEGGRWRRREEEGWEAGADGRSGGARSAAGLVAGDGGGPRRCRRPRECAGEAAEAGERRRSWGREKRGKERRGVV
eukprot:202786-Hanusia_phi.AAC.1